MSRRSTGTIFIFTSAFLYGIRYLSAALLGSESFNGTEEMFNVLLTSVGTRLVFLSTLTLIVGIVYLMLSWQNRCSADQSTLAGLFYELCDEISDLDWTIAHQQLIELLEDTLKVSNKKIQKLIKSQLQQWIASLPNNIKAYLPISACES
jgi:hypothetical protein